MVSLFPSFFTRIGVGWTSLCHERSKQRSWTKEEVEDMRVLTPLGGGARVIEMAVVAAILVYPHHHLIILHKHSAGCYDETTCGWSERGLVALPVSVYPTTSGSRTDRCFVETRIPSCCNTRTNLQAHSR